MYCVNVCRSSSDAVSPARRDNSSDIQHVGRWHMPVADRHHAVQLHRLLHRSRRSARPSNLRTDFGDAEHERDPRLELRLLHRPRWLDSADGRLRQGGNDHRGVVQVHSLRLRRVRVHRSRHSGQHGQRSATRTATNAMRRADQLDIRQLATGCSMMITIQRDTQ